MTDTVRFPLVLGAICLGSALGLAIAYSATRDKIRAQERQKKEEAIEYAKKCIVEVIRAKRELSKDTLTKDGVLEQMTKEELRQKCKELGIDSLGLKSELVARIKENLKKTEDSTETEEAAEKEIEKVKEEPKKPVPEPPKDIIPEPEEKKSAMPYGIDSDTTGCGLNDYYQRLGAVPISTLTMVVQSDPRPSDPSLFS